ncbi:DUF2029 domain-containing protein [Streptomyces lycii]|uniref:DUF2029 domain-containing protein n=2 Tax=Streptomyces lycii TaxID=2654337 RepID=A0ABQ7FK05_9ACTN|nr:glycosyltransferase 87 family protein [Streptomyces lycii]KAF4408710.1 DUF2029 domain-containing protein [Streptomyces lycii]
MADLLVYRAEGRAALDGSDLYGFTVTEWNLPATYPPFAALLFVPAAVPPLLPLKTAVVLGNVALLALLVRLSFRLARTRPRLATVLAVTAAGLWLEPVFQTVYFGQINLALACLVLWDLTRPDGARGKGVAVGIAAGIKLTPAIFAVYLLVTGRVRAALWALAGFAGTVAAGAVALPGPSGEFWTRRIFETGRVGKAWIVDNQSLQGLLARLAHNPEPGPVWQLAAVAVAAAGLLLARHAAVVCGREAWGVLCTACTALLVSPISWSHHWVWCVPLAVLLATRAGAASRAAAVAVAVVFTARSLWLVPHEGARDLRLAWWEQPAAAPYPVLALVLFAALALRLRGGPGRTGGEPPPPRDGARRQASSPAASSSDASTIR